jgi:hypothetical protein
MSKGDRVVLLVLVGAALISGCGSSEGDGRSAHVATATTAVSATESTTASSTGTKSAASGSPSVTTASAQPVCMVLQREFVCGSRARTFCLKNRTKRAERDAVYLAGSAMGERLLNELHRECDSIGVDFSVPASESERETIGRLEAKEPEQTRAPALIHAHRRLHGRRAHHRRAARRAARHSS